MGSSGKIFSLLIFFPGLFFLGCNSAPSVSSPEEQKEKVSSSQKMDRIFLQNYGETGLEWELKAPTVEAFSKENYMVADDLEMTIFQKGSQSSVITADQGILVTDDKNNNPAIPIFKNVDGNKLAEGDMYLKGNVVVVSTDGAKLETDWLWFHRNQELITSTAPVKVTRPDSVTEGVGLEATSDLASVKIFNQTLTIKDTEIDEL